MAPDWSSTPMRVADATMHTLRLSDDPLDAWHVSVALPVPGLSGPGPFPTLYLVDGFMTFPVAAHVARTTAVLSMGQLRPIAVVGITPATGDLGRLMTQRNRDLTPSTFDAPNLEGQTPYGTGGADAMLDLLSTEIVPHLEATYPLDPDDRALGGMSLGGLFACTALVRTPERFHRYLAVSPSLWWDHGLLLDETRSPAAGTGAGATRRDVYLAVGEREADPASSWPTVPPDMIAMLSGLDMVRDTAVFAARLRQDDGLRVHDEVIADEHHATVWPAACTRGLIHLYRTDRDPS
jgi:predicted alpha/beta superfamily hydrolase